MIESNPYRQIARIFAFCCYILAGVTVIAGIFSVLGASTTDFSSLPFYTAHTNLLMAMAMGSMGLVVAVMIALFGRRVQSLFGQQRRQEKLAPKSAVGCLRLGSLGCALWIVPSTLTAVTTGLRALPNTNPLTFADFLVGVSGSVLLIILMLSIAWFISANFTHLSLEDRRRAYHNYRQLVDSKLAQLSDPAVRAFVQDHTMDVLTKLDAILKRDLLDYLSQARLLTGDTRISLHNADFSGLDLRGASLPNADLSEINLERSNLEGAILFEASLRDANLRNTVLSRAVLQGADLQRANMTGAILDGTNLVGARINNALTTPGQLERARR